jgi:hypothetical protein
MQETFTALKYPAGAAAMRNSPCLDLAGAPQRRNARSVEQHV